MFILLISLQENKNKNKEKNANFVDLVVRRQNIVVWYFFYFGLISRFSLHTEVYNQTPGESLSKSDR